MRSASQQTAGWTEEQLLGMYARGCAARACSALPRDTAGARLRCWWQLCRYRHMNEGKRAVWRQHVASRYTIALLTVDVYQRRGDAVSLQGARKRLARWASLLEAIVDEASG